MADILQAGKWIKEGKQVRRKYWLHNSRIGKQSDVLGGGLISLFWDEKKVKCEEDFILSVSDLTTDEWEIAG